MSKLLELQTELKAPKNQRNTFGEYNYRSAEDILEALKPLLKKKKATMTISDDFVLIGERYYVKATVNLSDDEKDGEGIASTTAFAREPLEKKKMDPAQITGATSSYARKYALNGMFLIDDTKDSDTDAQQKDVDERAKAEEKAAKAKAAAAAKKAKVDEKQKIAPGPDETAKTEKGNTEESKDEKEKGKPTVTDKPWKEQLNDLMVKEGFKTADEKTAVYNYFQIEGFEERAISVITNWDARIQQYKDTLGNKEADKPGQQELDWDA
jgi:hypothetical protein